MFKSFLDMSIFWYALVSVATPSLKGTSLYTVSRSVLPYEGTEALGMAYKKIKRLRKQVVKVVEYKLIIYVLMLSTFDLQKPY